MSKRQISKERMASESVELYRTIAPNVMRKGDLRKLQIIEAAIACLSELGFSGTNYETVGNRCKMKRSHVAYHFPKWNELIVGVMKYVYATGQAVVVDYLKEVKDGKHEMRAYIEGTFRWFESYPEQIGAITLLLHLSTFDPKYREMSRKFKQLGVERVHAILYPRKRISIKSVGWQRSQAIHAIIVGNCIEWMCSSKKNESVNDQIRRTQQQVAFLAEKPVR